MLSEPFHFEAGQKRGKGRKKGKDILSSRRKKRGKEKTSNPTTFGRTERVKPIFPLQKEETADQKPMLTPGAKRRARALLPYPGEKGKENARWRTRGSILARGKVNRIREGKRREGRRLDARPAQKIPMRFKEREG